MIFVISKLIAALVQPGSILLICCALGLALTWRRPRPFGRLLLVVGVAGLLAVAMLPLDQWALLPLENRFPRPEQPPAHVDGIIVLGGAVSPSTTEDRGIPSLNASAERMTETVALARRFPDARLVFSGGTNMPEPGKLTEADVAVMLFTDLGIPRDRLILENASRTTYENAVLSKAKLQPKPGEIWLLVTSADTMARAVGAFRAVGWPVVPWPVGYKSRNAVRVWEFNGFGARMAGFEEATHEWIGLIAYWLTGRSSALFPSPDNFPSLGDRL